MIKKKGNMFEAAQAEREHEQAAVTATVTGGAAPEVERVKGKQEKITLSISEQDKMAVKIYAAQHKTTISDLLHEWIAEHCKG